MHQLQSLLLTVLIMSVTNALGQTSPYLSVSTSSLIYNESGGIQTLNIVSNTEWTVKCDADWLVVSPSTSTDDGTVTVNTTHNTGSERFATITITGHGMTEIVTVRQLGYAPPPIPSNLRFSPSGGTQHFTIQATFDWTISVEGSNGWLAVTPFSKEVSGNEVSEVTVNVSTNTGYSRKATITILHNEFIKQIIDIFQNGNIESGISNQVIIEQENDDNNVFNLSGRKVCSLKSMGELPHGVYVVNGKKIIK